MDFAHALHLGRAEACDAFVTFDRQFIRAARSIGAQKANHFGFAASLCLFDNKAVDQIMANVCRFLDVDFKSVSTAAQNVGSEMAVSHLRRYEILRFSPVLGTSGCTFAPPK